MYPNSGAQTVDLLVRSFVAHSETGDTFELMPFVSIPSSHTALGILGALSLKDLRLRDFCRMN